MLVSLAPVWSSRVDEPERAEVDPAAIRPGIQPEVQRHLGRQPDLPGGPALEERHALAHVLGKLHLPGPRIRSLTPPRNVPSTRLPGAASAGDQFARAELDPNGGSASARERDWPATPTGPPPGTIAPMRNQTPRTTSAHGQ